MRDILAERLLAKVMKWSPKDVAREMPDLQTLASYKYDEYRQFSPGMKFIESFALWLNQFESAEEKETAYEFIRNELVFISANEMAHLVTVSYPDIIRPILIQNVANKIGLPEYKVTKIVNSQEFTILRRQSLFLGLSDGAHTDIFRRSNPEISHEQVYQTYEISKGRATNMLNKLEKGLKGIYGTEPLPEEKRFRIAFLLDDFSGSGISYLRWDSDTSKYDGKIAKFYESIQDKKNPMHLLFDLSDLHIYVILYLATVQAQQHIQTLIRQMFSSDETKCTIQVVHELKDSIKLNPYDYKDFINLLEKYYDLGIETEHYLKGQHSKPYLGFDECALPLILSHNCPNNSVPLLWFEDDRKYRGLFPRVSRHGDRV